MPDEARHGRTKTIVFVTGLPGAGKTLVGLNVATKKYEKSQDTHAVFLPGNGLCTRGGLPATVAPVGLAGSGLPAGIQIIAPMWEDGTSMEFAALLADLVGGFTPPPLSQE
jgi:amidase